MMDNSAGYVRLQVAHSAMPATAWDASGSKNSVPILVPTMFGHPPTSPPVTELLGTKIGTEFHQPLVSQAVAYIVLCATCHLTYPALLSIMFGHLPLPPPFTELLGTKISTGFYEPLASQAVAGIALCATCHLTYLALLSIMFGHLPPSLPLTELLGTKIGTEFHQPLVSQAVAYIVLCATCHLTYPTLLLISFGHLPPLPPLTASLGTMIGTKIGTGFYKPLASQAVAGIVLCATCNLTYPALLSIMFGHLPPSPPFTELLGTKISTGFYEPLASQAVAGIALCATCHLTCPALLSIMFGHLPPPPPLTASLGTKISTGFYEPLASQAVAGIALCATCHLTYPALLSIMFGHLPPSLPLTELLGTKIGTEFHQPLVSQAVAYIVLCATCHLTYPTLLLIAFGHLPPLPPLTASLGTTISTGFYEPLASQAVAGIVLCATCHLTYPALLSIMFGHLPPSPPLTESLEPKIGTKIGTGFYEPLASQAVTGIALCATCHLTYPALLSIMFGHLPPSPLFTELLGTKISTGFYEPLTESLGTKISTEFYEPLASQAVAGIVLCATCNLTYPTLLSIMFGHLPPSPPLTELLGTKIGTEFHQPLESQAVAYIVLCATCHLTYPTLLLISFGHLPPLPPLTASLGTTIGTAFYEPLASQPVAGIVLCATCNLTYPALFLIMFGHLPPLPPLTESLETKIGSEFHQSLASHIVTDMAQCVACDVAYLPLLLIIFGHLPPLPPLTASLRTTIGTGF
ncbi:hypothetical protein F5879DRAFT_926749 [Lentinula edodes]|nr:hypothetical protein F5879DRAFT_926749 [Lentinula edodes]